MVTILPFIVGPLFTEIHQITFNPYNTHKQAYISQFLTDSSFHKEVIASAITN
jgi:hypothetical protein